MLSTRSDNCTPFVHIFDIISLFAAELQEPKIGISGKELTLSQTSPGFSRVCSTSLFENTVGKGEIARNEQFLLFPVFSTHLDELSAIFHQI